MTTDMGRILKASAFNFFSTAVHVSFPVFDVQEECVREWEIESGA